MDDIKAKQQIVEKIKASTNILVTVSQDPSVDALSAAIGLTLLLDKLDKHATAIFSGTVPPAIAFLEPEKVLDDTTDSLRDFIIALDKAKADHLRYKLEGDVVKIFITPYKTTITSDDLQFSQGDYNVELVIALGVDNPDHLDKALEAQGQILHDATVITVTAGDQTSKLGGIDWHDAQSSSLSEMVAGLAEAMKDDKNKSLLDQQTATAFLTGIVAETDRFSNTHTTARAMTVASQLMAAGADQQLIASKLQETQAIGQTAIKNDDESLTIPKDKPADENKESISISHSGETLEELEKRTKAAEKAESSTTAGTDTSASPRLEDHVDNSVAAGAYAMTDEDEVTPSEAEKPATPSLDPTPAVDTPPKAEEKPHEEKVIQPLSPDDPSATHSYISSTPSYAAPMNGTDTPSAGASNGYVLDNPVPSIGSTESAAPVPTPLTPPAPPTPADLGLPMPPEMPDFNAPSVVSPAYAVDASSIAQPERLGDILAPEPVVVPTVAPAPASTLPTPTPAPSSSTLPPLDTITPPAPAAPAVPSTPTPNDPGQFKIPGQS